MHDLHTVFQLSYACFVRLRFFWALSSHDSESSVDGVAASTAPLMYPLSDPLNDSAREDGVPCNRTGFRILFQPTGAPEAIRGQRALSTGRSVQGQEMDHEARVLPAGGGVRFGVYTGPMTKMISVLAVSADAVGAVGR